MLWRLSDRLSKHAGQAPYVLFVDLLKTIDSVIRVMNTVSRVQGSWRHRGGPLGLILRRVIA
jgi:hypothetical protein